MPILINKTDASSIISNGCLSYLKSQITFALPADRVWFDNPQKLIDYTKKHNSRNEPYSKPPAWMTFSLGGAFIKPTSYSLEGRRESSQNLLRSWEFLGKNYKGEWKRLHHENSHLIQHNQKVNFPLSENEFFSEFRINMTGTDSNGEWALCPGQIEIFGYITYTLIRFIYSNKSKFNSFLFLISLTFVIIL